MTVVAGTSPFFSPSPVADADCLDQIEFGPALDLVAAHAVSEVGAERLRSRRPIASRDAITGEVALVSALMRALGDGDGFRPAAVPDLRPLLDRLEVQGSVLDGADLLRVGRAVVAMQEVAAGIRRLGKAEPLLAGLEAPVPPVELAQRIDRAVEPDGNLKDSASPELRRARQAVRTTRQRLVGFLEKTLREWGEPTPDARVVFRDGRYVLPVRREDRSHVRGIVHGESGSGATLFVEPPEAVAMGNELTASQAAEQRAVLQVLRDLTEAVREVVDSISSAWEMCVVVDDVYARAAYALAVRAAEPALVDTTEGLIVKQARHPVLLDELEQVVPFDLEAASDARVIVISGPNTGGKTVLLKTVGLTSALLQSGVIPPVGKGSAIPVFSRIFSDIGDRQSIAESLSTFSGHLRALQRMLAVADDHALVLLDEFGTGTDPVEGAALAGAVLKSLCARGCIAIATTHLGQIKQLAAETEGAANASLQFDPDRLEPTYQFRLGVPGRSYGLAIARRLGFPEDVMQVAEGLLPDAERSLDTLLAEVEARELALQEREAEVEATAGRQTAEAEGLAALRVELAERAEALRSDEKRLETAGRAEARRFLLDARKRVEEALGLARAAVSETTAKAARGLVEEGVREEGSALQRLQDEAKKKGWTVRSKGGETGTGETSGSPSVQTAPRRVRRRTSTESTSAAGSVTEVDLRGMTADEAEADLTRALDALVVADYPSLRIIHGKGTGALRQRVSAVLKRDGRVAAFRQGLPNEGGWGVTIAELKR